jgi:hypothetical protein
MPSHKALDELVLLCHPTGEARAPCHPTQVWVVPCELAAGEAECQVRDGIHNLFKALYPYDKYVERLNR